MMRPFSTSSMFLLALSATLASAGHTQGPAGLVAVGTSREARSPKSLSPNNEWIVGTQLGVRFFGEGDFADNLLVSGLLRYEIPLRPEQPVRLPVFSNLGDIGAKSVAGTKADSLKSAVSALLSTAQGMNVGLYPYRVLSGPTWGGDLRVTTFGQMVGKVNTLKGRSSLTAPDTAEKVDHTMLQGRGALGVEFAIGTPDKSNPARRPLTVSLTAAATTFSPRAYELVFGERKRWIPSVELSAVLPIRDGAGILVEGIGARGHAGTWRIGMIVGASNKSNGNQNPPGVPAPDRDNPAPGAGGQPSATDNDPCLNIVTAVVRTEINSIANADEKRKAEAERLTNEELKKRPEYATCVAESGQPGSSPR